MLGRVVKGLIAHTVVKSMKPLMGQATHAGIHIALGESVELGAGHNLINTGVRRNTRVNRGTDAGIEHSTLILFL